MPSGTFWGDLLARTAPCSETADGLARAWQAGLLAPPLGACWTLSFSESRKGAVVSSLRQVLQSNVPPKYYLSARAATGILRRAGKRGQKLPARLAEALLEAAGEAEPLTVAVDARQWPKPIAPTLDARFGKGHGQDNQHVAGGCGLFVYVGQRDGGGRAGPARTLTTVQRYDALTENFVVEPRTFNWQQTPTLGAPGISQALPTQPQIATVTPSGVRRLTPVECERLQGFPDGHTSILSDAQRYKTLGNSMAVPVIAWIGERIIHTLHNGD